MKATVIAVAFLLTIVRPVTAQFPPLKVTTSSVGSGPRDLELVLSNQSAVSVTAYVYTDFSTSPRGRGTAIRFVDTLGVLGNQRPIRPEESRSIRTSAPPDALDVQLTFHAAVFADGTSFGDAGWVRRILDRRAFALKELEAVLGDLKAAQDSNLQPDDMKRRFHEFASRELSDQKDQDRREIVQQVAAVTDNLVTTVRSDSSDGFLKRYIDRLTVTRARVLLGVAAAQPVNTAP